MCVYWSIHEQDISSIGQRHAPGDLSLHRAARPPEVQLLTGIPSTLTQVDVRIVNERCKEPYFVFKAASEQSTGLFQRLRFPQVESFCFSFKSCSLIDQENWGSGFRRFLEGCVDYQGASVNKVRLEFDLAMVGESRDIDGRVSHSVLELPHKSFTLSFLRVIISDIVNRCRIGMNAERMKIRVHIHIECGPLLNESDRDYLDPEIYWDYWERQDYWDPWREPVIAYSDVFLCPALTPSTTRLFQIVTQMTDSRPRLSEFSISVQCRPRLAWNPKDITQAGWTLSYPAVFDDDSDDTVVRRQSADLDQVTVIAIPARGESFILEVCGQHQASECCLASRENEVQSLRAAMDDFRMNAESDMLGDEFNEEELPDGWDE
jgi:hypothetical protein